MSNDTENIFNIYSHPKFSTYKRVVKCTSQWKNVKKVFLLKLGNFGCFGSGSIKDIFHKQ